ncbi:MAG TPA: hypothetical protein VKE22_15850 [Haliangiales bacterium]|nr:hypothetical protein [Haliangiales bacterium]
MKKVLGWAGLLVATGAAAVGASTAEDAQPAQLRWDAGVAPPPPEKPPGIVPKSPGRKPPSLAADAGPPGAKPGAASDAPGTANGFESDVVAKR